MADERIAIEVVCAEAGRQTVLPLAVPAGFTAGEALDVSGIFRLHPQVDAARCAIGIFGREVGRERRLREGDRIEVLRPLIQDPRERRRRAARESGKNRSAGRR